MLNPLQQKLLGMLTWLIKYIDDNNIRYYIIGGTMLGAVRHEGFIPWDDDIDIAVPRNDYERLIDLLKSPVDHYVIESPKGEAEDYVYSYAKLYDLNTSMTELARKNVKRGVYIDIFPLDGIGNSLEEGYANYKKIDRANMLLAMRTCAYRKGRKWWKNIAVFIGGMLPINSKKLARKLDRLCSDHNFDDYQFVGFLASVYRSREIMRKEWYGTPTSYKFEGLIVYGPEKYEEYLTQLYGDWRKLPPKEKRYSAHTFADIDLNKSYSDI
jgi:lipopolysaccharide cholinephosphotransferase